MKGYLSHPLNRHLFIVDNIRLLKALDNDTIDLIVTDPPFGKGKTFKRDSISPPLTDEEREQELEYLETWRVSKANAQDAGVVWPTEYGGAGYRDIWQWQDTHAEFAALVEQEYPAVASLIETTRLVQRPRLAQRSHAAGNNRPSQRSYDQVAAYLSYMAVRLIEMRRILKPTGSIYLHCDPDANSYLRLLFDAVFGEDNLRNEIVWFYGLGGSSKRYFSKKHDTIYWYSKSDDYYFDKPQEPATSQRMAGRMKGMRDVWTDIPSLNNQAKERTGYPTQKPVRLAERIIEASSRPGDMVLDPFAGCAYAAVAAEGLGRQWIACDISPRALTVVRRQFNKFRYSVDGGPVIIRQGDISQVSLLAEANVTVCGPGQLPKRTDEDTEPLPPPLELEEPDYAGKLFERREMLELLLEESGWIAWCCGYAVRRPDGSVVETADNFHLDHIDPRAEGGLDIITNRAPLCAACNGRKGKRSITLRQLRQEISSAGKLLADRLEDLPDLAKMHHAAARLHAQRMAELGLLEM